MTRVKRGVIHTKHRKNILRKAKGYRWGRKSKIKLAKVAVTKALAYAYRDRRRKKREKRALWIVKLNAAAREKGLTYSQLINKLKKQNIVLDRKILADLATSYPKIFDKIVAALK